MGAADGGEGVLRLLQCSAAARLPDAAVEAAAAREGEAAETPAELSEAFAREDEIHVARQINQSTDQTTDHTTNPSVIQSFNEAAVEAAQSISQSIIQRGGGRSCGGVVRSGGRSCGVVASGGGPPDHSGGGPPDQSINRSSNRLNKTQSIIQPMRQ